MGKWAFNVLAAAWWILVGAGAVYFMTYKATPAPAAKPPRLIEFGVKESKQISPNEELRIILVPSQIPEFASRCLLYTNKDTNSVAMACDVGEPYLGLGED